MCAARIQFTHNEIKRTSAAETRGDHFPAARPFDRRVDEYNMYSVRRRPQKGPVRVRTQKITDSPAFVLCDAHGEQQSGILLQFYKTKVTNCTYIN